MNNPPLKQCPFCGSDASFGTVRLSFKPPIINADNKERTEGHFVNCMSCQANNNGIVHGYDSKEEAAASWNRRA